MCKKSCSSKNIYQFILKKKVKFEYFKILFLVPRIILIEQNIERLIKYNINKESIGTFFGEKKNESEITISTYQSVINNHFLIKKFKYDHT